MNKRGQEEYTRNIFIYTSNLPASGNTICREIWKYLETMVLHFQAPSHGVTCPQICSSLPQKMWLAKWLYIAESEAIPDYIQLLLNRQRL